jgi:tetratricopeptide (TPR) repeat protein
MMNQNLKNMLHGELSSAGAYLDRLFHALYEVTTVGKNQEFETVLFEKVEQLNNQFNRCFVSEDSIGNHISLESPRDARIQVHRLFETLPLLMNCVGNQTPWMEKITVYINASYQLGFYMHKFLKDNADVDVQIPRLNILEVEEIASITQVVKETPKAPTELGTLTLVHSNDEPQEEEVPEMAYQLFSLPLDSVKEFGFAKDGMLSSLIQQRKKKYQEDLHAGHQAIFEKDFERALAHFNKALNYVETAEVLTLIGWAYSLMEDLDQAKSYCLRAIQTDADYGPPYNDLGSYLLNEGQIEESLKWFDMAKKSINYQNREYPYINAGRAWMLKKNLTRALDEFSKALSIAPFNDELHSTVEKLKKSIHKSTTKINRATLLKKPELPHTLKEVTNEHPGNLN